MKYALKSLAVVALSQVLLSGTASAQEEIEYHELTGGTSSIITFSGDSSSVGLIFQYHYYILPNGGLQVGYDTRLDLNEVNDDTFTQWLNIVGIRYNFGRDTDLGDQLFVDLGLGFQLTDTPFDDLDLEGALSLYAGKRFAINDTVSYSPRLGILKITGQDLAFQIFPISLSVFL